MKKKKLLVIVLFALAAALTGSSPTYAESGRQKFVITYSGPISDAFAGARHVSASGPISGVGTETAVTQAPGPSPGTFVGTSVFSVPNGTVSIAVRGTTDRVSQFGPNDCFTKVTVSGRFDITGGTGEYTGANGGGTFKGKNRILPHPGPDGCSDPDPRLISTIRNTGTATLP